MFSFVCMYLDIFYPVLPLLLTMRQPPSNSTCGICITRCAVHSASLFNQTNKNLHSNLSYLIVFFKDNNIFTPICTLHFLFNLTWRGDLSKSDFNLKLKLLDDISGCDLYYILTHSLKWKPFDLETCICLYYLMLNFYQINKDSEIQTQDHLIIKTLISCQITIFYNKI